ncbi:MAG: single-stranded DNA-binding protein [Bacteroidales bacterium]|nr:single-stranded DNA-binding protein [Bacteroidales bacterium]
MSVNKAILVGFVGNDPEIRYLDSGTPVANFRLATTENYTNKGGEKVSQTEWHNVVLWRGLAEIAEKYVKKGSQVYIEGRIKTRAWDDRDGNKRYTTEIVADVMNLLGKRGEFGGSEMSSPGNSSNNSAQQAPDNNSGPAVDADGADDLPF